MMLGGTPTPREIASGSGVASRAGQTGSPPERPDINKIRRNPANLSQVKLKLAVRGLVASLVVTVENGVKSSL